MPKCIELLPCDWLISNLCYQAIEHIFLIKWPVSVYIYIYIYIYIIGVTEAVFLHCSYIKPLCWVGWAESIPITSAVSPHTLHFILPSKHTNSSSHFLSLSFHMWSSHCNYHPIRLAQSGASSFEAVVLIDWASPSCLSRTVWRHT